MPEIYIESFGPFEITECEMTMEVRMYMAAFAGQIRELCSRYKFTLLEQYILLPLERFHICTLPEDPERIGDYKFLIWGYGPDITRKRMTFREMYENYPLQLAWISNYYSWPLRYRCWSWTACEEACPVPNTVMVDVLRAQDAGLFCMLRPDIERPDLAE